MRVQSRCLAQYHLLYDLIRLSLPATLVRRLGVGLQPRYIKRNEEWRGRKVADYLLYSNNPPMVHLANTKVNFAAGF